MPFLTILRSILTSKLVIFDLKIGKEWQKDRPRVLGFGPTVGGSKTGPKIGQKKVSFLPFFVKTPIRDPSKMVFCQKHHFRWAQIALKYETYPIMTFWRSKASSSRVFLLGFGTGPQKTLFSKTDHFLTTFSKNTIKLAVPPTARDPV